MRDNAPGKNDRASFRKLIEADRRRASEPTNSRPTETSEETPTSPTPESREVPTDKSRLSEENSLRIAPVPDVSLGEDVVAPNGLTVVSELTTLPLGTELPQRIGPDGTAVDALLPSGHSATELDRDLAKLFTFLSGEEREDIQLPLTPTDVDADLLPSDVLPNLEDSSKDGLAFLLSLSSGSPDALSANGILVSETSQGRFSSVEAIAILQTLPLGQGPLVNTQPSGPTDAASTEAKVVFPANQAALAEPAASLILPGSQVVEDAGSASLFEDTAPLTPVASLSAAAIAKGQTRESDALAADVDIPADLSATESPLLTSETDSKVPETDARLTGAQRSTPNHAITGSAAGSTPPVRKDLASLSNAALFARAESAAGEEADLSVARIDGAEFAVTGSQSGPRNAAAPAADFASRITAQIAETIVTRAVTTQVGETLTLDAILDPPELGRLHFRITRSDAGLRAVVTAENGEVQQVIVEQTASIEQTVRTALNNDDSMQFQTADTPFDDGTSTAQDREQEQRPGTVDDRTTPGVVEADESPRKRKTAQGEVDILA